MGKGPLTPEEVECLICHGVFGRLGVHLSKVHGIDTFEYRRQFLGAETSSKAAILLMSVSKLGNNYGACNRCTTDKGSQQDISGALERFLRNKTCNAKYYQKKRDVLRLKQKVYEQSHYKERTVYHHEYYAETREKRKAYSRRYAREHLLDYLERRRRRRALLQNVEGLYTQKEFEALCVDCGNKCTYCGQSDVKLVPDHMTPLCKGGSNSIDNIAPACAACNSSKNSKTYEEYVEWRKVIGLSLLQIEGQDARGGDATCQ